MENAPEIAETVLSEASSAASRARKSVYFLLILVGLGVGFGKIASVESVSDRAIQNYRLQQIPKTLETKAKELREKGVEGERLESELARVTPPRSRTRKRLARPFARTIAAVGRRFAR